MQSQEWKQAMNDEFEALKMNETWDWIPYSHTYNIVGNKWVFKIKFNSNGSVHMYKTRLVAKGLHQAPGIDFT